MSVLYVALPVAILISVVFVAAFVWQMHSGQFDDLETPPRRILFDDVASGQSNLKRILPAAGIKKTTEEDKKPG